MSAAKKVIRAKFHLNSVADFNGELHAALAEADPGESFVKETLSKRYATGKTGELTIELNGSIADLKWTLSSVVEDAEKLHKAALEKARKQQYKAAAEEWTRAIALNPEDPDYYFNAGIAFFEEKNYREAIDNLEYAVRLCPIYYKAHMILGTVYLKLRKFDKSELHLKESIYFSPNNSLAILNLGAVYSILKKYDEGITAFSKIIKLSPNEPRAYFGLGKIFSIRGNVNKANECFRKVIELDKKGDLATHAKRAIVSDHSTTAMAIEQPGRAAAKLDESHLQDLYAEGYKAYLYSDYKRAVELYKKYVEHKSSDDFVWYSLGEAYLRAGSAGDAATAFRKAVKLQPKKGMYHKGLAVANDFLGEPEKVVAAAKAAISLGKKDSIVHTLLGRSYLKLKQPDAAIDNLEKALKLNKANLNAEYHLALAHAANDDSDAAIECLHMIMGSKVKTPIRFEAEQLLEKLQK